MKSMNNDNCQICGQDTNNGFCNWYGAPFSVRSTYMLCYYCICTLKPKKYGDINHVGTYDNDIYSLNEMVEDGFQPTKAAICIKALGKALKIDNASLKAKLKLDKRLLACGKRRKQAKR